LRRFGCPPSANSSTSTPRRVDRGGVYAEHRRGSASRPAVDDFRPAEAVGPWAGRPTRNAVRRRGFGVRRAFSHSLKAFGSGDPPGGEVLEIRYALGDSRARSEALPPSRTTSGTNSPSRSAFSSEPWGRGRGTRPGAARPWRTVHGRRCSSPRSLIATAFHGRCGGNLDCRGDRKNSDDSPVRVGRVRGRDPGWLVQRTGRASDDEVQLVVPRFMFPKGQPVISVLKADEPGRRWRASRRDSKVLRGHRSYTVWPGTAELWLQGFRQAAANVRVRSHAVRAAR